MMKRLGDYIRPVDVRNRDLKVTKLVGLTIDKAFIPSVANTIGTDLSNYKVISENQFACSLMQVSRDGKMPIAMFKGEPCIMSPAYPMFEVSNTSELLPEYLMMWFSRSEFDREASFYAVGGVRGSLEWNDFCDMRLPIPSIEKQREIVAEYNTLQNRIETNKKLIATLEQTAQALYKHTFVDNIDPNNLPSGWRMGTVGSDVNCFDYKRKPLSEDERRNIKGEYPYYGAISVVDYINSYLFDGTYILFSEDGANIIDELGHPALQYVWGKFWVNNHAHVLQGNDIVSTEYLFMALKNVDAHELVTGAAQPKINQQNMNEIQVIIPIKDSMTEFTAKVKPLFDLYKTSIEENETLKSMQTLLLSKMGC